ncbi:MAG: hypothetical protein SGI74_03090 [Oligoflexia bacterium]|nr:hypothetical protein [Oligoflexia bacterium]
MKHLILFSLMVLFASSAMAKYENAHFFMVEKDCFYEEDGSFWKIHRAKNVSKQVCNLQVAQGAKKEERVSKLPKSPLVSPDGKALEGFIRVKGNDSNGVYVRSVNGKLEFANQKSERVYLGFSKDVQDFGKLKEGAKTSTSFGLDSESGHQKITDTKSTSAPTEPAPPVVAPVVPKPAPTQVAETPACELKGLEHVCKCKDPKACKAEYLLVGNDLKIKTADEKIKTAQAKINELQKQINEIRKNELAPAQKAYVSTFNGYLGLANNKCVAPIKVASDYSRHNSRLNAIIRAYNNCLAAKAKKEGGSSPQKPGKGRVSEADVENDRDVASEDPL